MPGVKQPQWDSWGNWWQEVESDLPGAEIRVGGEVVASLKAENQFELDRMTKTLPIRLGPCHCDGVQRSVLYGNKVKSLDSEGFTHGGEAGLHRASTAGEKGWECPRGLQGDGSRIFLQYASDLCSGKPQKETSFFGCGFTCTVSSGAKEI